MVSIRNLSLLILIFCILSYHNLFTQQKNASVVVMNRAMIINRQVLCAKKLCDQRSLQANNTNAQVHYQQEQHVAVEMQQKNKIASATTQVHNRHALFHDNKTHLMIHNGQQEYSSTLLQRQQLSQDLEKVSREKSRQHVLQVYHHLAQRLNAMNFIANNMAHVGFSPHGQDLTRWCKSLTLREWQAITNDRLAEEVINAPYLLQYKTYREMVKAAPQFTAWAAEAYMAMLSNKIYDAQWCKVPNNTRDFIYNEGKAAYIKLETERLEVAQVQAQLKNQTSSLQDRAQINAAVTRLQEQNVLLTRSKESFSHELQSNGMLSKTLQAVRALGEKQKGNQKITFVDYHQSNRALNAKAVETLEALGCTKKDLIVVGTPEQHALYKSLFLNKGYEKIAALATSPKVATQDKARVADSLRSAVAQAQAGMQAIRSGDLQAIEKHFLTMQDFIGYVQRIESGKLRYQDVYSDATLRAVQQECLARDNTVKSKMETEFLLSPCYQGCVESCQHKERHTYLQENNVEGRNNHAISEALDKLHKGNHTITYANYELPQQAQRALQDADIPVVPFQSCVGNAYDHEVQRQACNLVVRAADLKNEHCIQRAASLEAASDALAALRNGKPHYAQQLVNVGHELTFAKNNALTGNQTDLSREALLRYAAKATELCCDFSIGVGKGAVLSALRTMDLATHPTKLLHEVKTALGILGNVSGELLEAAADIVCIHLPMVSEHDKHMLADRILERKESLVQLTTDMVENLQKMNAQDVGAFVGGFALDTITGKVVTGTVVNLSRRTKALWEVVKKSEKIARETDALSQRYNNAVQKIQAIEDRIKKGIGIADQPQPAVAGVPGNVGMELMEIEQEAAKGGKAVDGAKNAVKAGEVAAQFNIVEALKDIPAACKRLDPSVGNLQKLEEAIKVLKDVPGAVGKDGPISKLLENGLKNKSSGALGTARGAAYEMEVGLQQYHQGEEVLCFGQKINGREFDIVTKHKIIECKNLNWEKVNIEDFKSRIVPQDRIAKDLGKTFELHSKQLLPDTLKDWLTKKNIIFVEG